ncbi:Ig-like domain-containing protein [Vibrio sp. ZSDE26]|uniref:chitinase n=1 Tax=Vibrio amylolyticus TaxID=2847292 RepID=A0A9X2BK94_9VIBR|nr:Ig-like domain-containing protein [Vibrio amylolyticus]MCK6262568.1 Ig-like domain-containing protein [Vibrio amylolyticus]
MLSRFVKGIVIAGCAVSAPAFAYDCSNTLNWDSSTVYTSGDKVQQSNNAYSARYWTQGNDPATTSGPWEAWELLGTCNTGGGNLPPQVSLTSPLNNAVISQGSVVSIQATASDEDGSIDNVEFFAGNLSLGVDTQAPYAMDWTATLNTTAIKAVATDNEGASQSSQVAISVTPAGDLIPPSIELTSPTGNEQLTAGDTLVVTANAADSDGTVDKVDFYINNQVVATDTSEPYQYSWVSQVGTHSFKAKATDNDGQSTTSQEVSLVVSSGSSGGCSDATPYVAGTSYSAGELVHNLNQKFQCDIAGWCSSSSAWAYEPGKGEYWQEAWTGLGTCSTPPTVSITSPQDNQVVLAGSLIDINVDAADPDGTVTQVEIFANDASLAVLSQPPYTVQWSASLVGNNTIKALAIDNDNNVSEAMVSVVVSDQDLVVTLTEPSAGKTIGLGKSTLLAADATSSTGSIDKVDFLVNGSVVGNDNTSPYSYNWTPTAIGSFTVSAQAVDTSGTSALSDAVSVKVVEQTAKKHKLVGYWHNFVNGAGCPMRLAEMSDAWDIIDIAFAENDRNSNGTVHFNLYSGDIHSSCAALDPAQFKQDMANLQAQGKVFVLSLGGAEGTITLNTDQDEAAFVSSLTDLIKEWGFDGLDVDLESGSNLLHGSEIQARLGRALLQIEANIGGDMYLTMAPEHPYVQGGMIAYSGIWGAYIPVIDVVRDTLDLLHVQLYNNGGLPNPYMTGAAPEGSIDMMVAQSKMLIEGFELADGSMFMPLRDDQVAIGLPSGPSSANSGQAPTQNILDALDCLTKGTKCGTVVPSFTYPNYAGVMTWSINWDEHDGFNFSGPVGDKLTQMNAGQ